MDDRDFFVRVLYKHSYNVHTFDNDIDIGILLYFMLIIILTILTPPMHTCRAIGPTGCVWHRIKPIKRI